MHPHHRNIDDRFGRGGYAVKKNYLTAFAAGLLAAVALSSHAVDVTPSTTYTPLLGVGRANSGGAGSLDVNGAVSFYSAATFRGTPVANQRLAFNGYGNFAPQSDGVFTLLNDGSTDFGRLQLGGTSASFPALKRSTTNVAFRLADDSGDAGITAATIAATDSISSTKSQVGGTVVSSSNTNAGTAAYAQVKADNDAGSGYLAIDALGTGYTTAGGYVQDGGVIDAGANLSGGLSIIAQVSPIRFYAGSTSTVGATLTSSVFNLGSGTSFQLNGTTQKFPKTFTTTYDPASLAAQTARCDNVTVTGVTTTGGAVTANIGNVDPAAGCVMSSVRASAADTVRVCWMNAIDTVTACDTASSTWTFSQPQ